eukprot:829204-Prorocentrum_minimum.AAC.1
MGERANRGREESVYLEREPIVPRVPPGGLGETPAWIRRRAGGGGAAPGGLREQAPRGDRPSGPADGGHHAQHGRSAQG